MAKSRMNQPEILNNANLLAGSKPKKKEKKRGTGGGPARKKK